MFRCQTISWTIATWSMIFAYTLLTYFEQTPLIRSIPLYFLFAIALTLMGLVAHAASQTKTLLVLSSWAILSLIGICLRTLDIINDWHLNLMLASFTFIATGVWCVAGHIEDVTESGLYWYIWSLLSIGTILCAFNNNTQVGAIIYIVNTAILTLVHMVYIRHVFAVQTSGPIRCRHLFRVISCLCIVVLVLSGSICFKTEVIDNVEWQQWVIATEIASLCLLIIDAILGFAQHRINGYDLADTDDDSV